MLIFQILLLPDRPMQYCPTELPPLPLPPPPPPHHHLLLLLLLLRHIVQQPLLCPFIGDEDSFGGASTFDAPFSGATENLGALSFGAPAPFFGVACMFSLVVGGHKGLASAPDLILTPNTAVNHIN